MMNKKLLVPVGIALVIVIGVSVWAVGTQSNTNDTVSRSSSDTASEVSTESASVEDEAGATSNAEAVVIRYTNNGFDQPSYTVKKGQPVRVVNESSRTLEFSSDSHPTHQLNDELNLRPLKPGEEESFTPQETGSWGIHDHLKAGETTTLVVED